MKSRLFLMPVLLVLLAFMIDSCSKPHVKSASKVTVCELKELIDSDSNSYRMVYLYNSLCNVCEENLCDYVRNYYENKNEYIHHYLVAIQPNMSRFFSDTLMMFVLEKNVRWFAINDSNQAFSNENDCQVKNILNYLLQDACVEIHDGLPNSFFISDRNRLLKASFMVGDNRIIVPCEVCDIKDYNIKTLDFEKIVEMQ